MERITHLNGNGDIYFRVDGVHIRIDDIPILRVAQRLKLYEDAISAEQLPEVQALFVKPELRNAREVISRAEHGLLLIKELDRLEAALKKSNSKCESYVVAMAAANARHAEENLEMLKIIKELTDKLDVAEAELLRHKTMEDSETQPAEGLESKSWTWEWFEEWSSSTTEHPEECDNCGWRCGKCKTALEDVVGGYWDDPSEPPKLRFCPSCGTEVSGQGAAYPAQFGHYADEDGEKALEWAMGYCGRTNNAVTRYIADAVAEKLVRDAEQKGASSNGA